MRVRQFIYYPAKGWVNGRASDGDSGDLPFSPQVLLAFGSGRECNGDILLKWRAKCFPGVPILGCSTAGEIVDAEILVNSMVITAIQFDLARVEIEHAYLKSFRASRGHTASYQVGRYLGGKFEKEDLRLLFVLSDGTQVNGSELVAGLQSGAGSQVVITGGLAADGKRFQETQVIVNERYGAGIVGAIGLYGESLDVRHGSFGGWDPFGPDRRVTRSQGNVLYELDGRSALALYKEYLGEYAVDLPASGLLFPLSLREENGARVVRTLLGIDEEAQSMTFAGNVPEGGYVRLMRANFERLIEGAYEAAKLSLADPEYGPEMAILISCVGRRLVLQQRAEEELEEVREVLGEQAMMTGFYSYGEISPLAGSLDCALHNQTMTITTLRESRK